MLSSLKLQIYHRNNQEEKIRKIPAGKYQLENIRPATVREDDMRVLLKAPLTSRQYFIEGFNRDHQLGHHCY